MTRQSAILASFIALGLAACAGSPAPTKLALPAESALVSRSDDGEIADGIRALLHEAAVRATAYLAAPGGWDRRDATRLSTPQSAKGIVATLRVYGLGRLWDPVMMDLNRGVQHAAALSMPMLDEAIGRLVIADVRAVMTGGDDAATRLLCTQERENLVRDFATVLKRGLAEAGYFTSVGIMVRNYNEIPTFTDITAPDIEPELREHGIDAICLHLAEQEARMRNVSDARPAGVIERLLARPW